MKHDQKPALDTAASPLAMPTPGPTLAALRLRTKIADAAILMMRTQKPDGATQKGQDRIIVDRGPLARLRELCAALSALEAAEEP